MRTPRTAHHAMPSTSASTMTASAGEPVRQTGRPHVPCIGQASRSPWSVSMSAARWDKVAHYERRHCPTPVAGLEQQRDQADHGQRRVGDPAVPQEGGKGGRDWPRAPADPGRGVVDVRQERSRDSEAQEERVGRWEVEQGRRRDPGGHADHHVGSSHHRGMTVVVGVAGVQGKRKSDPEISGSLLAKRLRCLLRIPWGCGGPGRQRCRMQDC